MWEIKWRMLDDDGWLERRWGFLRVCVAVRRKYSASSTVSYFGAVGTVRPFSIFCADRWWCLLLTSFWRKGGAENEGGVPPYEREGQHGVAELASAR